MRDKGPPAFVAILLALVGIRIALPDSRALPKPETKPEPTAAGADKDSRGEDEDEQDEGDTVRGPVERFRHTGLEKPKPEALPSVPGWEIRSLIGCVPDPINSSSGDRFDSLVDAIQRAVETQGYVLQDFYYPWPQRQRKENGTPRAKASPAAAEDAVELKWGHGALKLTFGRGKQTGPRYRSEPGVLLFRRRRDAEGHSDKGRLLLVFLVGETATAGIHKRAFATSLRLIAKSPECQPQVAIRVLGPYFSGSQVSLERVLRGWADEQGFSAGRCADGRPLTVRIVSGSATGIDKSKLECILRPRGVVSFHATIIPEDIVVRKLLVYANLAEERGDTLEFKGDVAVLFESNTTFGHRAIRWKEDSMGKGRPVFFPFPLQISEVRAAYQQATGPTKGDVVRLPSFGSKLHLSPDKGRGNRETEPSLTPAMTAVLSERVLNTALNTITNERFRYVLIVATDPKDVLFLAGLVHNQCPRSRLLLCCNDLLHTHPDYNPDLRGSLVAATYPLYPRNQWWSFPFREAEGRLAFPGDAEQGYYNAAIALMIRPALAPLGASTAGLPASLAGMGPLLAAAALVPGRLDLPSRALLEYGPPFPSGLPDCWERGKPPVWIGIIGQGRVFPVAVYRAGDDDYVFPAEVIDETGASFVPIHTTLWIIPVLALILWLGYVGLACCHVVRRRSLWGKEPLDASAPTLSKLLWPPVAGSPHVSLRRRQLVYGLTCVVSVLVPYAYVTFVWLIPPWHHFRFGDRSPVDFRPPWGWIMPGILLLVPFVLAVLLLVSWAKNYSPGALFLRVTLLFLPRLVLLVLVGLAVLVPLAFILLVVPLERLWLAGLFVVAAGALWAAVRFLDLVPPASSPRRQQAGADRWPQRFLGHQRALLFVLFVFSVLFTYLFRYGSPFPRSSAHGELLFFFDRATSLANGVTPVLPVLLLGLSFYCWGYVNLRRVDLLCRHSTASPFAPDKFGALSREDKTAVKDLESPRLALGNTWAALAGLALYFIFCRLASGFVPSVDGVVTESLLLLGLAVLSLFVVTGLLHLLKLWQSVRKFLEAVASLPLKRAFERMPTGANLFGPYLSSRPAGPSGRHLSIRHQRRDDLKREFDNLRETLGERLWGILDLHDCDRAELEWSLAQPDSLGDTARTYSGLLEHVWRRPWLAEKLFGAEAVEEGEQGKAPPADEETPVRQWLARVEDFVALETVAYLNQFLFQLRNMMLVFLIPAPVLLLLAVSSYPFQPQRMWLLLSAVLVVGVAVSTIWILIQVERNEVLSRVLNTTPHRLNFHWGFIGHFLLAAAPLLAIPVIASSDVSNLVHAWLDPVLQLTK
jgi:hypothetical protein